MIEKIKSWFLRPEGLEETETPANKTIEFGLLHDNHVIGYLKLHNGIWTFEYSTWYKKQSEILPIVDFPDKEVIYKSEQLWPFFASRIPGLKQPEVEAIIRKENINKNDISALLVRFGMRSIQNPFRLDLA